MRDVDYTDDEGRFWRVRVPDDCPQDRYAEGIAIGPPSLASLELPLDVEVRLHNQLHARGILTRRDVLRRPNEVFAALQAAYRVDMQTLQLLYLREQGG